MGGRSRSASVVAGSVAAGSLLLREQTRDAAAGARCSTDNDDGSGSSFVDGSRLTADVLRRHEAQHATAAAASAAPSQAACSALPGRTRACAPAGTKTTSGVQQACGSRVGGESYDGGHTGLSQQQQQRWQQEAAEVAAAAAAARPGSVVLPPGAAPAASPDFVLRSVRAAREAAKANARARVATFVLPCGGPGDDFPQETRPHGRQRPAAAAAAAAPGMPPDGGAPAEPAGAPRPAVARALQLAQERADKECAARAAADMGAVAAMAARKAVLDAEAEALQLELRKKKQLLATTLASQVLERKIAALKTKEGPS